jgi:hypothetical protein
MAKRISQPLRDMSGRRIQRATVTLGACAIGAALAAGPTRAQAPIVTDGTMGARVELNGPAMQIPHTLGTQGSAPSRWAPPSVAPSRCAPPRNIGSPN